MGSGSSLSLYIVMWKIAVSVYGPNGGMLGVFCLPRICAPISAINVPFDCIVLLIVTNDDDVIVLLYAAA